MGKTKNKDKAMKNLKNQVSRQNKRKHLYEDFELEKVEYLRIETPEESKYKCPKCMEGLEVIDMPKIKIFICPNCDYKASSRRLK